MLKSSALDHYNIDSITYIIHHFIIFNLLIWNLVHSPFYCQLF